MNKNLEHTRNRLYLSNAPAVGSIVKKISNENEFATRLTFIIDGSKTNFIN